MPFQNPLPIDPYTIPSDAGPGEARIVIGTVLPPPLDTFLVTTAGGDARYEAAILIYGNGDDSRYQFIGVVPDPGTFGKVETHWGSVHNGLVIEENNGLVGGFPQALKMRAPVAGGPELILESTTKELTVLADNRVFIFSRNDDIALSTGPGAGGQITLSTDVITAAAGQITHTTNVMTANCEVFTINVGTTGLVAWDSVKNWTINSRNMGLGLKARSHQNSNSIAAGTSETHLMAMPVTLAANRAYAARLFGGCWSPSNTFGSFMQFLIRKGGGGAPLLNYWHRTCLQGTNVLAVPGTDAVFRTGGSGGTVQVDLWVFASSGTCAFFGDSDSPWGFELHDIGAASDYPGTTIFP